jgi:hypothetical protein
VPIIINTVLNEHQLVLDIVAFVALGDFPRSRLGEKQRGKILASWVSRKMRTIAQFSIRDPDAEGSVGTAIPEEVFVRRGSTQSGAAGTGLRGESSLRNVQSANHSANHMPTLTPSIAEHDPVHPQLRSHSMTARDSAARGDAARNDETPTNERQPPLTLDFSVDYSPIEPYAHDHDRDYPQPQGDAWQTSATYHPSHGYPEWPVDASHLSYSPEQSPVEVPRPLGTLKIANRSSGMSDDWGGEALKDLRIQNS